MEDKNTAKKSTAGKILGVVISVLLIAAAVFVILKTQTNLFDADAPTLSPSSTLSAADSQAVYSLEIFSADKLLYSGTIEIKAGESLLASMKAAVELAETDGFISSLCGVEQNSAAAGTENAWWVYTVNGVSAEVGAGDCYPSENDKIVFTLTQF
ncbi:MAG: DUF4430 domain-containing protein [Oscillospiraceae bacterium]|jgi:hypothetical protein|nr:DUF4430 domain-containing protein [Oscillospiraceae bacterium]